MTPSRTAFAAILAKDLRAELRTLQSLPAMALFAITTFVIFRFGLDRTSLSGGLAAGVLWATLLFAAVLGVNRLFVAEREEGGFDAIRLAPIDRSAALPRQGGGAARLPAGAGAGRGADLRRSSSSSSAAGLAPLVLVLVLADLGLAATGTLISSMAVNSRARDLLVPARPAAPGRAADDRRHRRRRAAAGRWAAPAITASAPGWRCSAYTI